MKTGNIVNRTAVITTTSTPEIQKCNDISAALKARLTWKWDDRFGVILAEFDVQDQKKIQSVLNTHFNLLWDQSNVLTAAENVRAAADHLGGIMGDQIFFTSVLEKDTIIYCAWWPWGNGQTISIRIALFPAGGKPFKCCFGL